ncbi:hypothetical protein SLS64_011579 [Diaporthe eres]|uniref:Protein kinase domain-containing protein n=1 Tax=Diaporthe eres TaxID=83184 RepID=A0ABR1NN27_DIAER
MGLRQERPGALAQVEQQIQQGYFPVKAALDPLDISISKILGWGGQAVAVLCELLGEGGQREKVVIKCQKPEKSDLASEIAHMDPGGPAPNPPAAPAQDVPDPVGPAPIPVAVYAGPNGFYTRVGDSGGTLHELEVHNNGDNRHSFVVLRDIRTYVVDVGADDPTARGSPATPIPVSTHAGQDGRPYATAWRPGFSVEELVVHTDMTNNTHYVEFDGRRTSILLMAGMPPRQA